MNEQWQCDEFCVHSNIVEQMQEQKITEEKSQQTADLFKVLGDNTRVKSCIICYRLSSAFVI